jgi:2-hydroxychromene-2-carboxylate isomerase
VSALRTQIGRGVARFLTSEKRLEARRHLKSLRRRISGSAATVHYFHQFDDPYSELAVSQLDRLRNHYSIHIECHAVPPPDRSAAPEAEALRDWSRRDAANLAKRLGLALPGGGAAPSGLHSDAESLERGRALRARRGHYLGAMFYFEGEWYWGVDRLHYLESRLLNAGLASTAQRPNLLTPPELRFVPVDRPPPTGRPAPTIEFFCSLRSPYTWLAVDRIRRLARHYGATLELKFVLPMVMRGLPIPTAKRFYILADAKREAVRLGLPFGDVADPVGRPAERGLAVLHQAIQRSVGEEFLESFLRGVFAEGVDAGSAQGLERIAQRAGIEPSAVSAALSDESWRKIAERHRNELSSTHLWGVPSFRVSGLPAYWGQDRLWCLEDDLIHLLT